MDMGDGPKALASDVFSFIFMGRNAEIGLPCKLRLKRVKNHDFSIFVKCGDFHRAVFRPESV